MLCDNMAVGLLGAVFFQRYAVGFGDSSGGFIDIMAAELGGLGGDAGAADAFIGPRLLQ